MRASTLPSSISTLTLLALAVGCGDSTTGVDEVGDATDSTTLGDGDGETNDETGSSDSGSDDATSDSSSSDDATGDSTDATDDASTDATDSTDSSDATDDATTDATSDDTTETGDPCGPECCPGDAMCEGDTSLICNDDGTAWEESEICDPIQGVICNGDGICEGACSEDALGTSYIGCDYFPTVTQQHDNYNTAPNHQFAIAVANVSAEDAMITITRGPNMVYDTVVPPGSVEVIPLAWINELTKTSGPSALVVDGAYRVRSDRPVVLYQYNPLAATTTNDASLLQPVNAWGDASIVTAWFHWGSYPGFYAVVAAEDDTTVTLTPSATGGQVQAGGGVAANGTGVVVLDESDVLEVMSSAGDLTGTLISADKPIQVISGHECTNVPLNVAACDHLEESMFPVQTLADEYIVAPPVQVPNNALLKAQIVRVVATEANTQVTFTPNQNADQVLANVGDFLELPMTQAAFLVSGNGKPILVVQYMVGQSAGFGTSDPAMLLTVPTAQYRNDYLFYAAPSWQANFVDILAPANSMVTVDGANVAAWTPIGATGFSIAHVALSNAGNGTHTVDSDQKVGISVYGVQSYGSYWYPGGLDLDIDPQ